MNRFPFAWNHDDAHTALKPKGFSPRYVQAYQTIHGQSKAAGRAMKRAFLFRNGALQEANRWIETAGGAPSLAAFSNESALTTTAAPIGSMRASNRSMTPS